MRHPVLLSALIATVLAGAGAYAVSSVVSGTNAETERMTAIADQFPADPDWPREPDHLNRNGYFCLPASGCAEMQRRWNTLADVSAEDLQARIDAAGWDMDLDGSCIRTPEMSGQKVLCGASGIVQGYEVSLSLVSVSSARPQPELVLNIY